MAKDKINTMDINDLITYSKATDIICRKYENSIKTYNGSINTQTREYEDYQKYNGIRLSILKEIEKRLENLELYD